MSPAPQPWSRIFGHSPQTSCTSLVVYLLPLPHLLSGPHSSFWYFFVQKSKEVEAHCTWPWVRFLSLSKMHSKFICSIVPCFSGSSILIAEKFPLLDVLQFVYPYPMEVFSNCSHFFCQLWINFCEPSCASFWMIKFSVFLGVYVGVGLLHYVISACLTS